MSEGLQMEKQIEKGFNELTRRLRLLHLSEKNRLICIQKI